MKKTQEEVEKKETEKKEEWAASHSAIQSYRCCSRVLQDEDLLGQLYLSLLNLAQVLSDLLCRNSSRGKEALLVLKGDAACSIHLQKWYQASESIRRKMSEGVRKKVEYLTS